jgi:hypothetical protein
MHVRTRDFMYVIGAYIYGQQVAKVQFPTPALGHGLIATTKTI